MGFSIDDVLALVIALLSASRVHSHGHMVDPCARNYASNCGFQVPVNYNSNQQNCGGFGFQWGDVSQGRCGVCGDPWDENNSGDHVYPQKYARVMPIVKTYEQGQEIDLKIVITANHKGSFTFRIGDIGEPPITMEKLTHTLLTADGNDKWHLPGALTGEIDIKLKLPDHLWCDHCVLQWWWRCGNSWGSDEEGTGIGYGPQEHFVNCADVRINANGIDGTATPSQTDSGTTESPMTTQEITTQSTDDTTPTESVDISQCLAIGVWSGQANMDAWCRNNCFHSHPNCPDDMCSDECRTTAEASTVEPSTTESSSTEPMTTQPSTATQSSVQVSSTESSTTMQPSTQASSANPTTEATTAGTTQCKAIGVWQNIAGMHQWCVDNCQHDPSYCPQSMCSADCLI